MPAMTRDQQSVLYEADEKVGIVSLNRPEKLNALSMELRLELERALRGPDDDTATSVIVLRGEGRSFCVGFDIGGGDRPKAPSRHKALLYRDPRPVRPPRPLTARHPR